MQRNKWLSCLLLLSLVLLPLLLGGCQEKNYRIQETVVDISPRPYEERPVVTVFPFHNLSGMQTIQQETSASSLVRNRLSETDRFRVVSGKDVSAKLPEDSQHKISVGQAIGTARELEAQYAVTGVINDVEIIAENNNTEVKLTTKIQIIDVNSEKVKYSFSPETTASDSSTGENIEKQLLWTVKQEMVNKIVNYTINTI